jgi:ribosomal protein L16 Arg81 hydroxylase
MHWPNKPFKIVLIKSRLLTATGIFVCYPQRYLPLTMIKQITVLVSIAAFFYSCSPGTKKNPVTDTDVATAFVRATLDNDLAAAEKFIMASDTNHQYFETFKRMYQQQSTAELQKYKAAEVIINELVPENDTIHTVIYSNSYTNKKTKLKLVWRNGKWWIDLKYTFTETPQ